MHSRMSILRLHRVHSGCCPLSPARVFQALTRCPLAPGTFCPLLAGMQALPAPSCRLALPTLSQCELRARECRAQYPGYTSAVLAGAPRLSSGQCSRLLCM